MTEITISKAELISGRISPEHLEAGTKAVEEDGFVILNDVIDVAHLEILHERMLIDLESILSRSDTPFQFTRSNVQQDPPPFPPYLFRDVMANPFVIAITKSILGEGLKNNFYSGNTALPSTARQPVHPDTSHLWRRLKVAHPAHNIVVNVPVVDVDAQNGSTEIWPGTHLDISEHLHEGTIRVFDEVLEKRRAICPPIQPTIKRGGVVIRDMRLWHAGMPNLTQNPRPMIAMIHQTAWLPCGKLTFAKGSEAIFADSDLSTPADFVEGEIEYLNRHGVYDFKES